MANEISLTAGLTVFKPSVMATAVARVLNAALFTMNGIAYVQQTLNVTKSAVAIPLDAVTQPHWFFFYSNLVANPTLLQPTTTITGAVTDGGLIKIHDVAHGYLTGDMVLIAGVAGTVEANGSWPITVIDADHYDLVGSTFVNAYSSGGTAQLYTNFRIRNGASGADLIQLFPGEAAFGPLFTGAAPYIIGNPAAQLAECLIFSW